MLVHCSKCQTQFELDEASSDASGVRVRCAVCSHLFWADGTSTWRVKTIDGALFRTHDFKNLRVWIREGRLHPSDQLSRTGYHWVKLGELPEFADAFSGFGNFPGVVEPLRKPIATVRFPDAFVLADTLLPDPESVLAAPRDVSRGSDVARSEPRWPPPSLAEIPDETPSNPGRGMVHTSREVALALRPTPEELSHIPVDSAGAASDRGGIGRASDPSLPLTLTPRPSWRWPAVVAVGLLGAVVVVSTVPSLRARVLGIQSVAASDRPLPELQVAYAAIVKADGFDDAVSALATRLKQGELDAKDAMRLQLAQVEVLATRSIVEQIAAALIPVDPSADRGEAGRGDAEFAAKLLDDTRTARVPQAKWTADLVALAQGHRVVVEGEVLEEGRLDLALVADSAVLWQDPSSSVPTGIVTRLQHRRQPSALETLALVLALHREGNREAALDVVEAFLRQQPDHDAARRMQASLLGEAKVPGSATPMVASMRADSRARPDAVLSIPPAPPSLMLAQGLSHAPAGSTADRRGPDRRRGEPTGEPEAQALEALSTDALVNKGCTKVERGGVDEGMTMLLEALKRRPHDLDVLMCLGDAHMRKGQAAKAGNYFQRALDRSPALEAARRGAARAAKRRGEDEKAGMHYAELLKVRPGDVEATEFLNTRRDSPASGGVNATAVPTSPTSDRSSLANSSRE